MLSMKMQLTFDTDLDWENVGSEVKLCGLSCLKNWLVKAKKVRVVSMLIYRMSLMHKDETTKEEILPNAVRRRVAVEMAITSPKLVQICRT